MQKSKKKQKKFLGTVPKKWKLGETFGDCPEISKINNKGITLIALIITIIVMLILVGVTINVAINGNLFEKAKTAATQTEEQVIYDQIVGTMALESSEEINVSETYSSMKSTLEEQGKTVNLINPSSEQEITNSAVVEVIGNNGTYTYTITETELIVGEIEITPAKDGYSFTIEDLMAMEGSLRVETLEPHGIAVPYEIFWAEYNGYNEENLKNSIINYGGFDMYKNMTCSSSNMIDLISGTSGSNEAEYSYAVLIMNTEEDMEDLPAGHWILLFVGWGDGKGFNKDEFNEVINTYNNVTFSIYAD